MALLFHEQILGTNRNDQLNLYYSDDKKKKKKGGEIRWKMLGKAIIYNIMKIFKCEINEE